MVQCGLDGTVSVIVGGKALPEYQVKQESDNNVRTYTCFIEGKEGAEYKVKLGELPVLKRGQISMELFIDGNHAYHSIYCTLNSEKKATYCSTFKGFSMKQTGNLHTIRAFTFEEDSAPKAIKDAGSIRVEITRKKRIGRINHLCPRDQEGVLLPTNVAVREDSKQGQFGLITRPGEESTEKIDKLCNCKHVDDTTAGKIVVIFSCVSHQWLVGNNLKKPNEADLVKAKAEELASQRASEAAEEEARQRMLRVQKEAQAKAEALKKKEEELRLEEEAMKRQGEEARLRLDEKKRELAVEKAELVNGTLELPEMQVKQEGAKKMRFEATEVGGNGDFTFASRQVGDVIVIDDD